MTDLRRRMDDDMLARGLADRTRESYLWAVTGLARFYHRSPDQITDEEIQAYVVHLLRDRQLSWSTCNIVVSGLRFFYHITLKRDRTTFSIPSRQQSGKLPIGTQPRGGAAATDTRRESETPDDGKGGKDRYTVLSTRLLEALRAYWKVERPRGLVVSRPWEGPGAANGSVQFAEGVSDGQASSGPHEARRHSDAETLLRDASA
jgi:integrase/recombinase XerD